MAQDQVEAIVARVARGELEPIAAADAVRACGEFVVGVIPDDATDGAPGAGLRVLALLGRLSWLAYVEAGASERTAPKTLEEYRDFFLSMAAEDEFPPDA